MLINSRRRRLEREGEMHVRSQNEEWFCTQSERSIVDRDTTMSTERFDHSSCVQRERHHWHSLYLERIDHRSELTSKNSHLHQFQAKPLSVGKTHRGKPTNIEIEMDLFRFREIENPTTSIGIVWIFPTWKNRRFKQHIITTRWKSGSNS